MRCKGTNQDGSRCRVNFGVDRHSGLCFQHNPEREMDRHRARAQGGRTSAIRNHKVTTRTIVEQEAMEPPETAAEAMRWASWVTWAVSVGKVDKGTAAQVNTGVRTFLQALDKAEMEEQIRELKAQVKELQSNGRRS